MCVDHEAKERPALVCPECLPVSYTDKTDRLTLLGYMRDLIGTPWEHGKRSASSLDCVGLMLLAGEMMGWTMPTLEPYELHIDGSEMQTLLETYLVAVADQEDALPGDLAWVRIRRSGVHLVALTEVGTIIHCPYRMVNDVQTGAVEEMPLDMRWASRVLQVYRYPEFS